MAKFSGKLKTPPLPAPASPDEDTIARKLLMGTGYGKVSPVESAHIQAMMLKHFNQTSNGGAEFSHVSLGTKLRRYGQ